MTSFRKILQLGGVAMDEIRNVKDWKKTVSPFLKSKVEELHTLGYKQATKEDLWNCLKEKVWKDNEKMRLYKVVADIMQLNSGTYLNYLTQKTLQGDDLMESISALLDHK